MPVVIGQPGRNDSPVHFDTILVCTDKEGKPRWSVIVSSTDAYLTHWLNVEGFLLNPYIAVGTFYKLHRYVLGSLHFQNISFEMHNVL